ncbi:Ig-like domain-containing protein, partial [Hyphobacterium sp. HN65]|nr:Ig-like domain-containing protein [Hyphobacterium sp. HN65]
MKMSFARVVMLGLILAVRHFSNTCSSITHLIGISALMAISSAGLAAAQDTTPPRISSIERLSPASSPTNADSVTWRVTFDEAVQSVTADMFNVTGTTGTLSVTNNSNTQTDVTLSGGDMAALDATVTLAANTGPPPLTNVANVWDIADYDALELNGALSVTTAVVGGTTYVFAAGADDNAVNVFSVADDGSLTFVANVKDDVTLELGGAYSVTTAEVGGTTYLFAAGYVDDGVSVFSVANDGSLTNVANVTDAPALELDGASSVTTAEVVGTTYLFAAGQIDDGVSVFSVGNDGSLTNVANVTDGGALELDGASSVTTALVGGTTYLFAAGQSDDGVSVFSVANDGSLTNVANVTDDYFTLELRGAYSVTTAVVGGTTFLFAAGNLDDGVSVFSVANDGSLTNVANVTDDVTLELDGASSVTTAVVGGTTYLFAASRSDDAGRNGDDGVSVFSVANDGSLTNVANVADRDSGDLRLGGASSATTAVVDDTTYLFAAGYLDDAVSVFSFGPPAISDFAGNFLANATPTGTNDNAFVIENTAPTLAITGPKGLVSGAFTATFTFSEYVTGFVVGDISVGNGKASNFQATSASVYVATITPTAEGAVTVDVAGSVAADEVGNNNTAATQFSVTNDETAPTLAITGPASPVSGAFTATFTFNEGVTGFVVGDISVGNGAASNFQATSATVYTATITPAAEGGVTVDVAADVAADAAGNNNTAASQFSVTNDVTAPTLAITGPAGPVSGEFTASLVFSEPITGFDISEIIVGNGSAKDLRAEFALPNGVSSSSAIPPATNFLVTITPASDGVVTVDVAGAVVQDAAANGNTAAT